MKLFVADDVGDAVRAEAARVFQIIIDKIEAVKTPPKITWVKPAAWHMTLRFIGEENGAAVPELCERLAPPVAMTPFEVEWRGVGAFPSPRHPHALAEGDLRRWPVGRARWVDRITLYRSQLSHRGPNYTDLVSAPLISRTNSE